MMILHETYSNYHCRLTHKRISRIKTLHKQIAPIIPQLIVYCEQGLNIF